MIEAFGTQGAGETIQAVISGTADLGGGVGVAGAMRAFSKGAPVRLLLPAFTGTGDLYWYVKADLPIKSVKDDREEYHRVFDRRSSPQHRGGLRRGTGRQAKPTATGGPPGTLTSVMSGQIDIGWRRRLSGLREARKARSGSLRAAATCLR